MVVAQQNEKALQTPDNNAILGEFLRDCLKVPRGCKVTEDMLQKKNTVRFYKVDDENFYMEF